MSLPISVLDLAPVGAGQNAAQALAGTTMLARRADELGFKRFWVAEHHNIPSVASTAPETLIAHLAALTERIHVGSGGVMLPNHSPLAVAERFGMLEALHPGRIDLGLGRAPGHRPAHGDGPAQRRSRPLPGAVRRAARLPRRGLWRYPRGVGRAHRPRAVDARLDRRRGAHRGPAGDPVRLRAPLPPALHRARARALPRRCSCPPSSPTGRGRSSRRASSSARTTSTPRGLRCPAACRCCGCAKGAPRRCRPSSRPSGSSPGCRAPSSRSSRTRSVARSSAARRRCTRSCSTSSSASHTDELMITSHVADAAVRVRGLEHVAEAFELAAQPVG